MKRILLIGIGLFLIALPLGAQDTTHRHQVQHPRGAMGPGGMDDMMPMMHEMMAPMLHVMAYTPAHLLARKDTLKLTADQVNRLTSIQNSGKSAHDAAAANMKTHMQAVSQAFQGATAVPDTSALRPHFEAAHAAIGTAHWAMVVAAAQARAVLTEAQRQKVDAWVTAVQQRMRQEHTM